MLVLPDDIVLLNVFWCNLVYELVLALCLSLGQRMIELVSVVKR